MNKRIKLLGILITALLTVGCFFSLANIDNNSIACSNDKCEGQYSGAEFIDGSDIAHQFSNKMSAIKLKELFKEGEYSIVDFDNIEMTTKWVADMLSII